MSGSMRDRAMAAKKTIAALPRRFYVLVAVLFFILPLNVTYGDEDRATIQIINATEHYLHVIINGQSFLYIAPRNRVFHDSEETSKFDVRVLYAPGQGVTGNVDRTLEAPYRPASTGCEETSSGGCECVTNPPDYGSVIWEVTADTLAVGGN